MHEMAIGILWLDKGDCWIYLTCCVALNDFFFFVCAVLPYSIFITLGCVFSREAYVFVWLTMKYVFKSTD